MRQIVPVVPPKCRITEIVLNAHCVAGAIFRVWRVSGLSVKNFDCMFRHLEALLTKESFSNRPVQEKRSGHIGRATGLLYSWLYMMARGGPA